MTISGVKIEEKIANELTSTSQLVDSAVEQWTLDFPQGRSDSHDSGTEPGR